MKFNEFEPGNKQEVIDTLAEKIATECAGYLDLTKALSHAPKFLYRGVADIPSKQNPAYFLQPQTVRKDRKPRDTHVEMHNAVDNWMANKFRFRARSQGLFVIGSPTIAADYGEVCIVFPIKEFDYLWNEKIDDLTFVINNEIYFSHPALDPSVPMQTRSKLDLPDTNEIVNKVLDNGKWHYNAGFTTYLNKFRRNEMTMACPYGYYIVPLDRNFNNICWIDIYNKLKQM